MEVKDSKSLIIKGGLLFLKSISTKRSLKAFLVWKHIIKFSNYSVKKIQKFQICYQNRSSSPFVSRSIDLNTSESKIPIPRNSVVCSDSDRGRRRSQTPCAKRPSTPIKPCPTPIQSTPIKRSNSTPTKGNSFSSSKSRSSPKISTDDIGSRLYNNAKEIEIKKEKIKNQSKPKYTFTPVLSERNEKILSQKNRCKSKSLADEVAVVSGMLSFTKLNIPFKDVGNSVIFKHFDFKSPPHDRVRPLIPSLELNSANASISLNQSDIKENIYD
ncbi:unnamed protein product [Blepharisma stoltei]|uniref:Uncharacterized protein n=1 Tax=Blepharisma stoltei TaxID=1481888 RepID=A0AAU9IBM0_9CILI|nr:unnamed protein product [Blepharisma stoltei]